MTEREAAKIVLEKLKEVPMFCGKYDAKNSKNDWIYGVWAVMEMIAYMISEEAGEDFNDMFSNNMEASMEKVVSPITEKFKSVWGKKDD